MLMIILLTGCKMQLTIEPSVSGGLLGNSGEPQDGILDTTDGQAVEELSFDGKIVIITNFGKYEPDYPGSVIEEDMYLSAKSLVNRFGQEQVIHKTWPSYGSNAEDLIDGIFQDISEDTEIKAMILLYSYYNPYIFDKLETLRDDIYVAHIVSLESDRADYMSVRADLIIHTDLQQFGETYVKQAVLMGAETIAEYSYPMSRSDPVQAIRRDAMKSTAGQEGIEFMDLEAPTPGGGDWLHVNQKPYFIQDLPRQVERLGKSTAFYWSYWYHQDVIMTQAVATGAIIVSSNYPLPYFLYPEVFEVEYRIETDEEDENGQPISQRFELMELLQALDEAVTAAGMAGRVSCWAIPDYMMWLTIGFMYAAEWLGGNVPQERGVIDINVLERLASEYATQLGIDAGVTLETLSHDGETLDHYVLGAIDFYVFGK